MRKNSIIIALAFLALTLLYKIPAKAESDPNILSSSGTATMNAEPDMAVFTLAVETENKALPKAIQENNDKANKVVSEVKKILGKDDSIKTAAYNVNPVYSYDNKERKSVISGYRVTNTVNIKTKKISDVGKIMNAAINCGANRTDNLDFIVENKDKYSNILLKQATAQAKQKASITAQALGVCIKGVKRVSTNFSDEQIPPYYRASFSPMAMKGVADAGAPPIETGEVKLNANVMVDFIIEDLK